MAPGNEKQKKQKIQSSKPSISHSKRDASTSADANLPRGVPLKVQQQCLDIFRDALSPSADDATTLQEVKGHLYNRDFAAAFGKESYLRVYASRWSPSRALAYLDIFNDIWSNLDSRLDTDGGDPISVLCLGGGAGGELVALAGWVNLATSEAFQTQALGLDVTLVDIADWTTVITRLREGITTPPQLSKYASQAKKDANEALLDSSGVSVSFLQHNILDTDEAVTASMKEQFAKANLVTCMFTLNELYSTSMSKTQQLLLCVTAAARPGMLLLVVDSPGSYSTVSLNGTEKKYPMQWLLDYTLLGPPRKERTYSTDAKWEKMIDDSSHWFRRPEGLEYPIELENMRYQIHLYRRLNDNR